MKNLKQCPFCGKDMKLVKEDNEYSLICETVNCFLESGIGYLYTLDEIEKHFPTKICPKCGKDIIHEHTDMCYDDNIFEVGCSDANCYLGISRPSFLESEKKVIDLWN